MKVQGVPQTISPHVGLAAAVGLEPSGMRIKVGGREGIGEWAIKDKDNALSIPEVTSRDQSQLVPVFLSPSVPRLSPPLPSLSELQSGPGSLRPCLPYMTRRVAPAPGFSRLRHPLGCLQCISDVRCTKYQVKLPPLPALHPVSPYSASFSNCGSWAAQL